IIKFQMAQASFAILKNAQITVGTEGRYDHNSNLRRQRRPSNQGTVLESKNWNKKIPSPLLRPGNVYTVNYFIHSYFSVSLSL
ncbi:hypothetical protein, partial [Treponema primitia]|uniref:hypothetical protein n=1 Tax=Treponema primitia TaxID=88058 RepID=UPI001E460149